MFVDNQDTKLKLKAKLNLESKNFLNYSSFINADFADLTYLPAGNDLRRKESQKF
jgi:hypothetical protein